MSNMYNNKLMDVITNSFIHSFGGYMLHNGKVDKKILSPLYKKLFTNYIGERVQVVPEDEYQFNGDYRYVRMDKYEESKLDSDLCRVKRVIINSTWNLQVTKGWRIFMCESDIKNVLNPLFGLGTSSTMLTNFIKDLKCILENNKDRQYSTYECFFQQLPEGIGPGFTELEGLIGKNLKYRKPQGEIGNTIYYPIDDLYYLFQLAVDYSKEKEAENSKETDSINSSSDPEKEESSSEPETAESSTEPESDETESSSEMRPPRRPLRPLLDDGTLQLGKSAPAPPKSNEQSHLDNIASFSYEPLKIARTAPGGSYEEDGEISDDSDDDEGSRNHAQKIVEMPSVKEMLAHQPPLKICFRPGKTKKPEKNPGFQSYVNATTINEMVTLGASPEDVIYDLLHGTVRFVDIEFQQKVNNDPKAKGARRYFPIEEDKDANRNKTQPVVCDKKESNYTQKSEVSEVASVLAQDSSNGVVASNSEVVEEAAPTFRKRKMHLSFPLNLPEPNLHTYTIYCQAFKDNIYRIDEKDAKEVRYIYTKIGVTNTTGVEGSAKKRLKDSGTGAFMEVTGEWKVTIDRDKEEEMIEKLMELDGFEWQLWRKNKGPKQCNWPELWALQMMNEFNLLNFDEEEVGENCGTETHSVLASQHDAFLDAFSDLETHAAAWFKKYQIKFETVHIKYKCKNI